MSKGTVLVVDDAPGIIYLLQVALEHAGYRVVTALADVALNLACAVQPDVILLDIFMPGMDGVEVSRRLRADPRTAHIPVIVISAQGDLRLHIQATQLKAVDCLSKPFELDDLLLRVARWVEHGPDRAAPAAPAHHSGAASR